MILKYTQMAFFLIGLILFLYGWVFPKLLRAMAFTTVGLLFVIFGLTDIPNDFKLPGIGENESTKAIEKDKEKGWE